MYKPEFKIGDIIIGLTPEEMHDLVSSNFTYRPDIQRETYTGKIFRVIKEGVDYSYYKAYDLHEIKTLEMHRDRASCRFKKL